MTTTVAPGSQTTTSIIEALDFEPRCESTRNHDCSATICVIFRCGKCSANLCTPCRDEDYHNLNNGYMGEVSCVHRSYGIVMSYWDVVLREVPL
jgi:hypothetical protein